MSCFPRPCRFRSVRWGVAAAAAAPVLLQQAALAQCTPQWLAASPGVPGPNGEVDALVVYKNTLIVGGSFTNAGPALPLPANHIASWNGTNWSILGPGFNDAVLALAVYHNQLI